ncbi:polyphenol oxidase family protein [Phragmitibacter flavus]|nr:polyphenol oxidase family protein [Phragmitibacter flavus]
MSFAGLSALERFVHTFTLRHPTVDVQADRAEVLRRLGGWHADVVASLGFELEQVASAEQVHGNQVAVVRSGTTEPVPGADGLVCGEAGVLVGIYVADCCAVYAVDPVTGAFGVAHAGRKGAESGITTVMIETMKREFGVLPENLTVQLSPCIRPPVFEIDFAKLIRDQAANAGVPEERIFDEGISTASDLERYYSYRVEKGKTGRMFALLGRRQD